MIDTREEEGKMIYHGHVINGVVVLDGSVTLPEGLNVKIEPVESGKDASGEKEIPTLYERLEPLIGKAEGLPPDMSVNHDHYLYGLPKRQ
jgi:hypothetical protein